MNKFGMQSAAHVIRRGAVDPVKVFDCKLPKPGGTDAERSTLPCENWPQPIGSVSRCTPAEPQAMAAMPRLPQGVVTRWPVRFKGVDADYARLWFASLVRMLLTGGLYWPWARVRSQHYMMRHTRVAGYALGYHERPANLLPRYILSLTLMVGVAGAWAGSMVAGMLATSLALTVWPLLVFMNLHQRLAHISWAGRRLAFDGLMLDVYRALWAPLAGGGALAWLLMAAVILHRPEAWVMWGAVMTLWLLGMPMFVWTWFEFRQRHIRLGPLSMRCKATRPAVLMLFARTLVWALLTSLFSVGVTAMALAAWLVIQGPVSGVMSRCLAALGVLMVCAAVQPYLQARVQNLLWSKTGNRYVRVRSTLSVAGFVQLRCRHVLLMALTLGLYWPWAEMATRRMRTQALTIWSRVDLAILQANWPPHKDGLAKMPGSPAQPRG